MIAAVPRAGEANEMTFMAVPASLAALYEQHSDAVFRAAFRVTGNAADAEDVLQTVFLRLLSQDAQQLAAGHAAAYVRRAAVNAAVDLLRRRAIRMATPYDEEAPHAAVDSAPLLKEELRRAIATLDRDDASLFLLRYVEGLSNQELADLFQIEKNNVAVRLHRIRLRLQAAMNR